MAMLAALAMMAGQQVAGGIAANNEGKYNAGLFAQQAGAIDVQKGIEEAQYNRAINQMRGTVIARTAKSGFQLSGSPLALEIDNLTQMELDKSIGQYELEAQKRYALSAEKMARSQGRAAMYGGFANAFSTALMAGADYASRGGFKMPGKSDPRMPKGTWKDVRNSNGMMTKVPVRF